jgi:hypothetical protein
MTVEVIAFGLPFLVGDLLAVFARSSVHGTEWRHAARHDRQLQGQQRDWLGSGRGPVLPRWVRHSHDKATRSAVYRAGPPQGPNASSKGLDNDIGTPITAPTPNMSSALDLGSSLIWETECKCPPAVSCLKVTVALSCFEPWDMR